MGKHWQLWFYDDCTLHDVLEKGLTQLKNPLLYHSSKKKKEILY